MTQSSTNNSLDDPRSWHRLHPLSPVLRFIKAGAAIIAFTIPTAVSRGYRAYDQIYMLIPVLIALVAGVLSWWRTRWRVEGTDLRIERGLLQRSSTRYPLSKIQAIDVIRPLAARIFGLTELRIRSADATSKGGSLAYLSENEAEQVRMQLLALARGTTFDTGVVQHDESEYIVHSVPTSRLIASLILGDEGVILTVMIALTAISALINPALLIGTFSTGLALVSLVWRRFNDDYGLTVAEGHDGLRVRSGLLDTTSETIPRGRIQSVRMLQPFIWRLMGWYRIQIALAGGKFASADSQEHKSDLRTVLVVGDRQEADWLISRLLPQPTPNISKPPLRARWLDPWAYHFLGWANSEWCGVMTRGRITKVTVFVPLARVQGMSWRQGPLQRFLNLASVHIDTAGHDLHACAHHRDAEESLALFADLTKLCRSARAAERGSLQPGAPTR